VAEVGIHWVPLHYHKKPSAIATFYDIFQGVLVSAWLCLRYHIRIVHARSYVPSVMALVLKKLFGIKFIFDMRGFWADERVDGGIWLKESRMYQVAKWFEKHLLLSADYVVSLTQAAVDEMKGFPYLQQCMPKFKVITTCTDLERFKFVEVGQGDVHQRPFTLGYVGSVGVWYLFDETLRCFKALLQELPDARLHILNRGEHAFIRESLLKHEIPDQLVFLETTDHLGVARAMQQMDAAIFFIKPAYSKSAGGPTKLGEFRAWGVPCLGNAGVGDMAEVIESEKVGVALADFSEQSMHAGIQALLELVKDPAIRLRCREAALRHFSLEKGVESYDRIYRELAGQADTVKRNGQ
jgi:glycosyltransferase involved in cell wall biosynthesis